MSSDIDKINKCSLRETYMGRTPSKKSRTGREVIERMKKSGMIQKRDDVMYFLASDNKWYPISEADMAHIDDAVSWWNREGYKYGAKSKEVREFMLDSSNYILDHFSINRSQGATIGETYIPPLK